MSDGGDEVVRHVAQLKALWTSVRERRAQAAVAENKRCVASVRRRRRRAAARMRTRARRGAEEKRREEEEEESERESEEEESEERDEEEEEGPSEGTAFGMELHRAQDVGLGMAMHMDAVLGPIVVPETGRVGRSVASLHRRRYPEERWSIASAFPTTEEVQEAKVNRFPKGPTTMATTLATGEVGRAKSVKVNVARVLPHIEQLPPYTAWIPLKKNYTVDDEKVMSHFRYFGDDEEQQDEAQEVRRVYEDLRGEPDAEAEEVYETDFDSEGDFVLMNVVHKFGESEQVFEQLSRVVNTPALKLNTRLGFLRHKPHLTDIGADGLPVNEVLHAVKEAAEANGADIVVTAAPKADTADANAGTSAVSAPGDDEAVTESQVERTEQALLPSADKDLPQLMDEFLSSIGQLFCRVCYEFDCQLHGVRTLLRTDAPVVRDLEPEVENNEGLFCGDHCWLRKKRASRNRARGESGSENESSGAPASKRARKDDSESSDPVPPIVEKGKERVEAAVEAAKEEKKDEDAAAAERRKLKGKERVEDEEDEEAPRAIVVDEMSDESPQVITLEDSQPIDLGDAEVTREIIYRFPDGWTGDERCLLLKGAEIFGERNVCRIAKIVRTRKCEEVGEICDRYRNYNFRSVGEIQHNAASQLTKGRQKQWRNRSKQQRESSLHPVYEPCNCVGMCDPETCTCIPNGGCEKFCRCRGQCSLSTTHCVCRGNCRTRRCPCFARERECDPDLCLNCGACDVARDVFEGRNPDDAPNSSERCGNVNLLARRHKHLMLVPSRIAGWGVCTRDAIAKDDFIMEYVGELISHDEAERRGTVYDKVACSYLFDLNLDLTVDAHRKGNKAKFMNHSDDPNCFARIMMSMGRHRIGFFAKRNIAAGEELFFDYQYQAEHREYIAKTH